MSEQTLTGLAAQQQEAHTTGAKLTDYQGKRYQGAFRRLKAENELLKKALDMALAGPDLCPEHLAAWQADPAPGDFRHVAQWRADCLRRLADEGVHIAKGRKCRKCQTPLDKPPASE